MDQRAKAELLRSLHYGGKPLVLANAWDVVTARLIEAEGFPAIATSSAGCAAVLGYADGQTIPRHEMLGMIARIAKAVDVPVTADVEAGYDSAMRTALDVVEAGAVGLNIEDMVGGELIPLPRQIDTVRATRAAGDSRGIPLVVNARTDIYLASHGDPATRFERAVERLNAYREAGADCLFIPGIRDAELIAAIVVAVNGPINILATPGAPSIAEMRQLGVARISFGSGTSRVALGATRQFVRTLRDHGTYDALGADAVTYTEMQALLKRG